MPFKQRRSPPKQKVPYGPIYDHTQASILALGEMSETELDDAATELSVDYEVFLMDYEGPYLVDSYVGFLAMLHEWPVPWPPDISNLGVLTMEQFLLVWAWEEDNAAKYCLDGEAVANGWKYEDAMECGVIAAVGAAKSLVHAEALMASGEGKIGQAS